MRLIFADVPVALYDDWRQIIVLPRGLGRKRQAQLITELIEERR